VIFGRRISKQYRGKLQTEIEDMNLPNPVIHSHYGNGFIKQYVRDHLILRTEAASNNVNDYGVKKSYRTCQPFVLPSPQSTTTISTSSRISSRRLSIAVNYDDLQSRPLLRRENASPD
jgi:hypothetical protein